MYKAVHAHLYLHKVESGTRDAVCFWLWIYFYNSSTVPRTSIGEWGRVHMLNVRNGLGASGAEPLARLTDLQAQLFSPFFLKSSKH